MGFQSRPNMRKCPSSKVQMSGNHPAGSCKSWKHMERTNHIENIFKKTYIDSYRSSADDSAILRMCIWRIAWVLRSQMFQARPWFQFLADASEDRISCSWMAWVLFRCAKMFLLTYWDGDCHLVLKIWYAVDPQPKKYGIKLTQYVDHFRWIAIQWQVGQAISIYPLVN